MSNNRLKQICLLAILLALVSFTNTYAGPYENTGTFLDEIPDNSPGTFLSATIATDMLDYAPGDSVIITGGGFMAGEQVSIDIDNVYNPGQADPDAWIIIADGFGFIETYWIVPEEAIDQTFILTADGLTSGLFASTLFTDASTELEFVVEPGDVCGGATIDVCAFLREKCGGGAFAPLPNRPVLFFLNPGNCGNDVAVNADDTVFTDANGVACATLTAPTTPGTYTIRIKFEGEDKPASWEPPNSACNTTRRRQLSASNDCKDFTVSSSNGSTPLVTIADSTVIFCDTGTICLPVNISDPDCDIDSVTSSLGQYSGTLANTDQIARINQLGGTVTQIGGGDPGKTLLTTADFVAPINSLSGVSVTIPNFIHATSVIDYGPFPTGTEPGNSADHLLYSPTDMTFTTPGVGGPDGGSGDGSVAFTTGNQCVLGFNQTVTTCDGMNVDFMVFTNTNGGGTAQLTFRLNGAPVHTVTQLLASNTSGSGNGGVTFDLPDGITFNEIKICSISGTLEIDAVAARTAPSSTSTDICFFADTSGVYEVIVTAYDGCFNVGADTAYVTVSLGNPPIVDAGADFTSASCALVQICFPVSSSDPDGDLILTELYSGLGTYNAGQVCFTPPSEGSYTFILRAEDACGNEDYDTVVVTVTTNDPPVAVDPDTTESFLCASQELCQTLNAFDPNSDPLSWTLLSGDGSVTLAGEYCLTPTATAIYSALVVVSDTCGLADTIEVVYDVTLNSTPVANDPPSPVDRFYCDIEEICHQFSATDVDGGSLSWSMLSGNGTISAAGLWCFTPSADGSYTIQAVVTDSCGAADTTSKTINVTLNDPPVITLDADFTADICNGDQVCFNYTVSDPQGLSNLTEQMVAGFGAIDTSNNEICFTPTADGTYEFIVSLTDSCGTFDKDTIVVTVNFGGVAVIDCPTDPINVSLCAADMVCEMLSIAPATATITTSFGTYASGQLCFQADTSGTYNITVIADDACGSDTCQISFVVDIGSAATIDCPPTQSVFLCESDTICTPVGINGSGVTVDVSPVGFYQAGNVCFVPDTAGHYEIEIIATTSCGSDTCLLVVDVTLNANPVAVDPVSPVDTFLCNEGSLCFDFAATDSDGGSLVWNKISGSGTVSSTGTWCFSTAGNGSYNVIAEVVDSCGAADTVSMTYNITINSAPVFTLGNDTTIFLCADETICLPYTATDIDDNIASFLSLAGGVTIDTNTTSICFLEHAEGTYQYIVEVTDECGATDVDTINVTLEYNQAPTVNAGMDQDIFQCTPAEICWSAGGTDLDGNLATVELVSTPGTFDGTNICFTPDQSWCYEFILKATDSCGLEAYDTVAICVELNEAPVADAGTDQTLFQCAPTQVCWPVSASDVNNNLTGITLISSPGAYDGTNICFTPTASGLYEFIIEATDACGLTDRDTVTIDITINSDPVCSIPNDTIISQCLPAQVCLPVTGSDTDGNLAFCQIVSGPGSLVNGEWCYTPTASQVVNVTIRCEDSCGAYCESSFSVEFKINRDPEITFSAPVPQFLCSSTEICVDYTVADPDDPQAKTVTLVSGSGTLDEVNSKVCFTPTASGSYEFIIQVVDDCGALDADTVTVDVTINNAPVANAGADQAVFLCASEEICWPAGCSDVDGNLVSCQLTGPGGTYDGTKICFTPTTSGSYEFILTAMDNCDIEHADTVTIDVTLNSAPEIAFGADESHDLCDPQEICLPYTVSDIDGLGSSTESLVSGPGTIDAVNNQVCFTPTVSGSYEFIVMLTDSCGLFDKDTIVVNVTFGDVASISCPANALDNFLCAADSIVYPLAVSPLSATVTASYGTYSDGAVRFLADTAGTYVITVIASSTCGADTCAITFNVEMNQAPVANAGADQSIFQCAPAEICWPVSCSDPDGNLSSCVLISGTGTYNGSQICFTPTGAGSYQFILEATDACGLTDRDTVTIDVTENSAPTITAQADITQNLCDPTEICVTYSVADTDGLTGLTEAMVSGFGTLDTLNNQVCFTPTTDGTYEIIVKVTDPCGEADYDTVLVDVTFGASAAITCPTTPIDVNLCSADNVCQMIDIAPSTATVTASYGTYLNGELCFMADTSGTYIITLIASETCGADTCQVTFNVDIGSAAVVNCPTPQSFFLCEADTVCVPVGVNGSGVTVSVSPTGFYQSGNLCFVADTAGHYEITIIASTACGSDTCVVVADVTMNGNPVAVDPTTPVDTFMCAADQVCYQFAASDADGGTLTWARLSGSGTVSSSGEWCFDVTTAGSYCVDATVTDDCGAKDTVSICYNVTLNSKPIVTLPNDTTITLCSGAEYCFNYTATDVDGNITLESLTAGTGTIDTGLDEVCFTPASSGSYQFIVTASDACGANGVDTINIDVTIVDDVVLTCPANDAVFLCGPDQICRPLGVSNSGATITVSPIGTYDGSQVCFDADTAGLYEITVIASTSCDADTCTYTINVTMNNLPVAVDPASPVDTFICATDQICYQFEASDADGGSLSWMKLSGAGTVSASGEFCFDATASGSYSVQARVTDDCGGADTVTITYNVTINSGPQITAVDDAIALNCGSDQLCYPYFTNDPDDNVTLEQLLSLYGTIDTVTNQLCFNADTAGVYTFIFGVTDACGLTDADTLLVTVNNNTPPVANAGADQSVFLCDPAPVCWPATCSDVDANLTDCVLTTAVGSYDGSDICFTPDTAGTYTFILQATDACGAIGADTVEIEIRFNSAPMCQLPADQTIFQCEPEEIRLAVFALDPDTNLSHCEILSGPGSLIGNEWVFTPSADQNVTVTIMCVDECGLECTGSFTLSVELNQPPVVDAGDDFLEFQCSPTEICFPVTASDPNNNLTSVELISSVGTFDENSMTACFTPGVDEQTYRFIFKATDACGLESFDTVFVEVDYNAPPVMDPPPSFVVYLDMPGEVCFDVNSDDPDGNLSSVTSTLPGTYNSGTDQVCFEADTSGVYCMTLTATDDCGAQTVQQVCITIQIDECIHVSIEKTHAAIQGQFEEVRIFLNGSGKELGGFDILIGYDQSALNASSAVPGNVFTNCGWEYFTYRFGADGNCSNACPSGLMRIIGIADMNNGAYHPDCFFNGQVGDFIRVNFLVSNDRTLECQYAPVKFFWLDCGDNSFSSRLGDTLWVSRDVFEFEGANITDNSYGFPGYYGAHDDCLIGGGVPGKQAIRCADFTNGGIDIVCADSIDAAGDINMNEVAYEIADAVLYSNYFVYGLSVFTINVDGQIAASDVNKDGLTLSVADLVYLIRVITGEANPYPKPVVGDPPTVEFAVNSTTFAIASATERIGAISMLLEGDAKPSLHPDAAGMDLRYNFDGENTRVLIYNQKGESYLETGSVLNLFGAKVKQVEVGSFDGVVMSSKLSNLPDKFELYQNYPNPFNPYTTIKFALPVTADYELVVYNILGQVVERIEDRSEAGYVTIEWDASPYASGVYFYRLKAGEFSSTRKMVLLK